MPENRRFSRSFSDHFLEDFGVHFGVRKSPGFQKMEVRRRPLKQRRFRDAFLIVLAVSGTRCCSIFESLEVKFN